MVIKGFTVVFILFASLFMFSSCGKKNKQQAQQQAMKEQARQQAVQDSIALAQAKREAQLAAQRERDRINKQKSDSDSVSEQEPVNVNEVFSSSGDFTLQVSSWRSQWKARKELKKWKERGYKQAYLMKYGSEKTGDVWFRVRLGHLQSRSDGKQVGMKISSKYNANFWVARI